MPFSALLPYLILVGYAIIVASCIFVVLSENKNPIRAISWTIALIFLPAVGVVFYLFFGRSLKGRSMVSRRLKRKLLQNSQPNHSAPDYSLLTPGQRQMSRLAQRLTGAHLHDGNDLEIFISGREKFDQLKKDILAAQESIYIQYYIYSDDSIGNEILSLLAQKARDGVEVKVLYDHVGSFSTPNAFFNKMRSLGIEAHPFFQVTFRKLANRINWRNHRKICVIDGSIGYIGGMNIADRYVDGPAPGQVWRDTHLRVRGPVLESMLYSFAVDWNFLRPDVQAEAIAARDFDTPGDVLMQLVTSGPIDSWDHLALVYQQAISSARKSIYIQTPYFLPTDALLKALEAAALSGVDVRVMIPEKTDSHFLGYGSASYIEECLKAGVKFYFYLPGMLHAKTMIIDDNFVTTGSLNFDFRSFENNFEGNLLIYSERVNAQMRDIFFDDIKQCRKVTLTQWRSRPWRQKTLESLVRLFAPIL